MSEEQAVQFDFEAGKNLLAAQQAVEEAKTKLREAQRTFLATGSVDVFREKLKEATGGKAKEFLYILVQVGDEKYCAYVKGNEKVANNGGVRVTYGYWEEQEVINVAQVIKFYDGEEGEYTQQWEAEEKAYNDAEEEAARLAEEEAAAKQKAKEDAKAARLAEKQKAKAETTDAASESETTDEAADDVKVDEAEADEAKADAPKTEVKADEKPAVPARTPARGPAPVAPAGAAPAAPAAPAGVNN